MAYNRPYYQAPPPQAPAYPSHPPPAAAYASFAAPPPPAAPVPAQNPAEAFRHFFRSHLATLTFNSRPVINHLTQLALDQTANFANAVVVSEEIAKGIFEALPQHKLPPFYLLDSIAKNFPVPYAALFTRHVPPLFSSAYTSVDGTTKAKLEEMLRTWRNGGPKGEPVFGLSVQEELEARTWGREYVRQMQQQAIFARAAAPPAAPAPSPHPHQPTPVAPAAHYAHSPSPYPQAPAAYPPPGPAATRAPPTAPAAFFQQQQQQQRGRSPQPYAHQQSQPPPLPSQYPTPPTVSTTPLPPPPAGASAGLEPNLLHFLSGLLTKAGSASPAPAPPPAVGTPPVSEQQFEAAEAEIDEYDEEPDAFERLVLELDVRLDSLDLKANLPRISNVISAHLPQQCRACGLRAPASRRGEQRLALHLDWHYRSNRRARESEGRGNSRAWFVDAKDWVSDQSTSVDMIPAAPSASTDPSTGLATSTSTPSSALPAHPSLSSKPSASTLSTALRAELMRKKVIQPSDPEVAARPCPVCKEVFKGEFDEADEEWVWHNAVEDDGVIYHATCRHDAAKGSSIATQLLAPTPSAPSSAPASTPTPTAPDVPMAAPSPDEDVKPDVASLKRKSPEPESPAAATTPAPLGPTDAPVQEGDGPADGAGAAKRLKLEKDADAEGIDPQPPSL